MEALCTNHAVIQHNHTNPIVTYHPSTSICRRLVSPSVVALVAWLPLLWFAPTLELLRQLTETAHSLKKSQEEWSDVQCWRKTNVRTNSQQHINMVERWRRKRRRRDPHTITTTGLLQPTNTPPSVLDVLQSQRLPPRCHESSADADIPVQTATRTREPLPLGPWQPQRPNTVIVVFN